MNLLHKTHAAARVQWARQETLGRVLPPPASDELAATIKIAGDPKGTLFSALLSYRHIGRVVDGLEHEAHFCFLSPDRILPKLREGDTLLVTAGPTVVATARVLSVYH